MKIAIAQMTSGIDPHANARILEQLIADAAQAGAGMLFTPEMSGMIDRDRKRAARKIVSEVAEPVLAAVRGAASLHHVEVALGSLAIAGSREDGRWANRSFLIGADGAIRARYDKLHLFDVDLSTGESWRESSAYAAGNAAIAVDTCAGTLGLSICYDLRFPSLYQALSVAGAEILSIPAAFTVPTGEAHWHVLMRARAIENAAWVIAAAQTGRHEDGRVTYGHSLVVNPSGEVILDMGEEPGLGFVDIDLARVVSVRARIPVLEHRRPIPHVMKL
jgi:predicted amidohydrolase